MPPSMRTVVPVIAPARALARKATRSPTSSAFVNRPIGISAHVDDDAAALEEMREMSRA
jgi:hypothetical protein